MGVTGVVLLLVAALGILPILYAVRARNDLETVRQWHFLMAPWARAEYQRIEAELTGNLGCARHTYAAALELTGRFRRDMLDLSLRCLVDTAPSLQALLGAMLDTSLRLAALCPAPPLRPAQFGYRPVRGWAWLHRCCHHFVVSTRERYAFRLFILGRAVRTVVGFLKRREARDEGDRDGTTHAAWEDYRTLGDETLESLRLLLVSISAVPAADRVPRPGHEGAV